MDKAFLKELAEFVSFPSVSAQPKHIADCVKAAKWLSNKLKSAGVSSKMIPIKGPPLVYGRYVSDKKAPHIVLYGHYDVQPAEPFGLWKSEPFKLTQKGNLLFARGVADDKSSVLALLWGLHAAIKTKAPLNITCLFEGEEEGLQSHLAGCIKKLKKQMGKVDFVALSDTTSISPDQLTLTTGVRGVMSIELFVRGLPRDLHSGYGGPIPNAARELSRVIGDLYNSQGWVTIPGFYKGAQAGSPKEIAQLQKICNTPPFARKIGARGYYPHCRGNPFEINCFYPSLEINGITGGYQGVGGKTIIPATASAKITCRIAAGQDPRQVEQAVIGALKERVDHRLFESWIEIHHKATPAYMAPYFSGRKSSAAYARAVETMSGCVKQIIGNSLSSKRDPASIPVLVAFKEILGADSLALGLYQEESHIHSPNENVHIRLLENGIRVWEAFFKRIGR
jgi:acetylornithine deacetylase/succinyl-diaminopimelate desuccinylase-like protein